MPLFRRDPGVARAGVPYVQRRVRRREIFGLLLWITTVVVVVGTLPLPLAAGLPVVLLWMLVTGIAFIVLMRSNLRDTEESLDGGYLALLRAKDDIVTRLAMYSEGRDGLGAEHLHRVRENATLIAYEMGIDIEEARGIGKAAVAHDLGKIGIPDAVLGRPSKLTPDEFEEIKKHTTIGERMLGQSPLLEIERQITRHHHEWWDGTGYPDGLTGTNIPIAARITAVADVFDTLMTGRPFRDALSLDDALTHLQQKAGFQFDPDIVQTFVRLVHQGEVRGWESAGIERGKAFGDTGERVRDLPEPIFQTNSVVLSGGRRMRVIATSDELASSSDALSEDTVTTR